MRDHRNDDLISGKHGHLKAKHKPVPEFSSSDQVPAWTKVIYESLALLIEEVRQMKQSTTDLIAATNDLVANDAAMEAAVDALVQAQADGDDAAVEVQVTALKNLKANQSSHLAALVAAVPPVVAAPTDPAPVTITPAAAKQ